MKLPVKYVTEGIINVFTHSIGIKVGREKPVEDDCRR